MSKHRREKTAREVTCDRIVERVAQLVEPWTEHVSQTVPPGLQTKAERETWQGPDPENPAGPPRVVVRTTTIEQAPLLEQLLTPAEGSTAGTSSPAPSSRPPTNLEPMAAHQDIQFATLTWCRVLVGQKIPAGPAARLRRLAELAPTLLDETLHNLDRDVTSWWAHARVATTWADPPMRPHVPCSECGAKGRIRVRLYPTTAVCLECGSAWDGLTINQLGTHVQLLAEHDAALAVERMIDRRPCATCGIHHEAGHYGDPAVYAAHVQVAV